MSERIDINILEQDPTFTSRVETIREYMKAAVPLDTGEVMKIYYLIALLADMTAEVDMSANFHAHKRGVHVMITVNTFSPVPEDVKG